MRVVAFILPVVVLAIGCSNVEVDPPGGGGGTGGTGGTGGEGGTGGAYDPFPESCTPSDLTAQAAAFIDRIAHGNSERAVRAARNAQRRRTSP